VQALIIRELKYRYREQAPSHIQFAFIAQTLMNRSNTQ
jgi:hypothetical protein